MRASRATFGVCLVLVLFLGACAFAELLICGKCGYESKQGSLFCSHCGASLRAADDEADGPDAEEQEAGDEEKAVPAAPAPDYLAPGVVEADMKLAADSLARKNGWLGLFFCENAMALNLLTAPDTDRSGKLMALHGSCEQAIRATERACPTCGGKGSVARELDTVSSKGERLQHTGPSVQCSTCNGTGMLRGKAGLVQLAYEYGQASKEYELYRQSCRWVPVGQAWVPPERDGKLNARQTAMVKRAAATRCRSCLGFGQITCDECKGTGRRKCPNKKCSGGTVERDTQQGLSNDRRSKKSGAPVLRVTCDTCNGNGTVPCAQCGGRGSIVCKVCSGAGKRPPCRKCDGEATRVCGTCRGTGSNRGAPCNTCAACGVILCSSCQGDGRRDK